MGALANWIVAALRAARDEAALARTREQVRELCRRHPVAGVV
jgi:glycine/serine hydroxymethyltransferase